MSSKCKKYCAITLKMTDEFKSARNTQQFKLKMPDDFENAKKMLAIQSEND